MVKLNEIVLLISNKDRNEEWNIAILIINSKDSKLNKTFEMINNNDRNAETQMKHF